LLKLEKKHIKPASLMLARAFKDDFRDIFPDPEERRVKEPYINELLLRWDYAYCQSFMTSLKLEGIAMWMHSDNRKKRPPWHILTSGAIWLEIKIGRKAIKRMDAINRHMEKKHSELAPFEHWYLSLLAVDPQYQGKGYGSKLLNGMLARIDEEGLPCYVEAEGEKNVSLYQHFGFEVVDEFILPNTTDTLTAMIRKPKPNKKVAAIGFEPTILGYDRENEILSLP
jgi:ribosomal protein S18 acetylase RimI-like enzyme